VVERQVKIITSHTVQRPAEFVIWKKKAAAQFSLLPGKPREVNSRAGTYFVTEKGRLFVTCSDSIDKNKYNWKEKVSIGLDEHEVGKLLHSLKTGQVVKFYHDKYKGTDKEGEVIKILHISEPNANGVIFLNLSQKGTVQRKINGVSVDTIEARTLAILLECAIGRILGWI
jgi:hypothetical protein